jgi:phosphoglucomutase
LEIVKDYSTLISKNVLTGAEEKIDQKITADVLQFFTVNGTKISVRPSGTEPKIKFYIEVKAELKSIADFDKVDASTDEKINEVMDQLVN